MPIVFEEVDPDDLSTVLFSYNDSSGAANIAGVKTWLGMGGVLGLSAPGVNIETSDRQGDGAQEVIFSYDDIVQSSFQMRALATSYDNLRTAIGKLQQILGADGVIRWIPQGSTSTYYLRRKPSPIPALFNGNELELYKAGALLEGTLNIGINRERLIRGATLLASVNILKNSTLLGSNVSGGAPNSNDMSNWAWDSQTSMSFGGYGFNVSNANQSYRFTIATTGTRKFQQITAAATAAPADVWTLSFYAKASGGALCKAQAVVEFINSGTTTLATATGTLTTLSSTEQRLTVTTSAAPANTDHMKVSLQYVNGDATSYTVDMRRAQLEKAASASVYRVGAEVIYNLQSNSGPWKSGFFYNPGDANALARLTLAPSSSANAVGVLLGRKSEGLDVVLPEMVNNMGGTPVGYTPKMLIVSATLYGGVAGDTASQADATATNGATAARTTFTNQASLVRRWRWATSPSDKEALHGRWDVMCAIRPEVGSGTNTQYRVCLHWQAANRDPLTNVEDEINIDATDATSSVYTPLKLGTVEFDADAGDGSLILEGWAAQDAGSGNLWWDVVYLVPADEQQTLVQVPGFRTGEQSREVWLGSELVTRPAGTASGATVSNSKIVIDTVNEGAGMPPGSVTTGGLVWAAGWHQAKATIDLRVPAGTAKTGIGHLRIRKAPGVGVTAQIWAAGVASLGGVAIAVGMIVRPISPGSVNGRTYRATSVSGTHTTGGAEPTWPTTDGGTVTDNPGANQIVWTETTVASRQLLTKLNYTSTRKTFTCGATADGSTAYEIVVVAGSGITGVSGKIHVLKMEHATLRVVDDTYAVQMLGDLEIVQTANGTAAVDDLVKQGPFITLGPGLNVLWVDLWSLPPSGYDDMTKQELAKHDPTRTTTVSVDIIPRYWG